MNEFESFIMYHSPRKSHFHYFQIRRQRKRLLGLIRPPCSSNHIAENASFSSRLTCLRSRFDQSCLRMTECASAVDQLDAVDHCTARAYRVRGLKGEGCSVRHLAGGLIPHCTWTTIAPAAKTIMGLESLTRKYVHALRNSAGPGRFRMRLHGT